MTLKRSSLIVLKSKLGNHQTISRGFWKQNDGCLKMVRYLDFFQFFVSRLTMNICLELLIQNFKQTEIEYKYNGKILILILNLSMYINMHLTKRIKIMIFIFKNCWKNYSRVSKIGYEIIDRIKKNDIRVCFSSLNL